MTETDARQFFSCADLPAADAAHAEVAHNRIMRRHVLAVLKSGSLPIDEGASTGPRAKDLGSADISTLLHYLQRTGYEVDQGWLVHSLVESLPKRTTAR